MPLRQLIEELMVLKALSKRRRLLSTGQGDQIFHVSNTSILSFMWNSGYNIITMPIQENGIISFVEQVKELLNQL